MKKSRIQKAGRTNSGYALFTAIIMTGVLILISYITANISIKELLLSTSAADSHLAFYNTDTGLECALYWDIRNPNAVPPGSVSAFDINTPGSIICNGQTIDAAHVQTVQTTPARPSLIGGGVTNPTSIFQLNLTSSCVIVKVTKNPDGTTLIESLGYNSCTGSHRFERGVKLQY